MTTEVRLPQWGMGMTDGAVLKWLKEPGDPVVEGEPLVEIETAKTVETLEAPASGTLAEIVVPEGQEVEIYTVLAIIEEG